MSGEISFGNVLTMISLLIAFFLAHRANVKRIEDNTSKMTEMKIKLDVIYTWFEGNVIGRGERPRQSGGGGGV